MTQLEEWNAKRLVRKLGRHLVGKTIDTQPYGSWTGGLCKVTEVHPDPAAPEIVFNVRRIVDGEEVGVFDHETVRLAP